MKIHYLIFGISAAMALPTIGYCVCNSWDARICSKTDTACHSPSPLTTYNNTISNCATAGYIVSTNIDNPSQPKYLRVNSCQTCQTGYKLAAKYAQHSICSNGALYYDCEKNTTGQGGNTGTGGTTTPTQPQKCDIATCTANNNTWQKLSDMHVVKYIYSCKNNSCEIVYTVYGCANHYYGPQTTNSVGTCTQCPLDGKTFIHQGEKVIEYPGMSADGATSITDCYLPPAGGAMPFYDDTGTFQISGGNCYWKE